MEGGERRVAANDLLGGRHPPSEVVGVEGDGLRWLEFSALELVNLPDLGDIALLEEPADSEGMAARRRQVSGVLN